MKKKDLKELRLKGIKELIPMIKKSQIELVKLATDFKAGKLKNIQQLKAKRRELAIQKTFLREKQLSSISQPLKKEEATIIKEK